MFKHRRFFLPAFAWAMFPVQAGAFLINQPAAVVVGQPDFSSSLANNGGLGGNTLNYLTDVCSDGTRLFIADEGNQRVLIYNRMPTTNHKTADAVIGQPDMTSNTANYGGVGPSSLNCPTNIYCDGKALFVADQHNHRVLIYNPVPATNHPTANIVIGQPDMTSNAANLGNTVSCSANSLNRPHGVFSDGKQLFIADRYNNRVLIYNNIPTQNGTPADVVVGQPTMNSNAPNFGGISARSLNLPFSVQSDGQRLFITDSGNHRVLIYNSIPTQNGAAADVVLGQAWMTSNLPGPVSAQTLNFPLTAYCENGSLYVSDCYYHRVLIYNTVPTVNYTLADTVIGQPSFNTCWSNFQGLSSHSLNSPLAARRCGQYLLVADNNNSRVLIYTPPFYTRALSPNHAFSGMDCNVSARGTYGSLTPTIKLFNGSTYTFTTSLGLTGPNSLDGRFKLQVQPGLYAWQATQDQDSNACGFPQFFVLEQVPKPMRWQVADIARIPMPKAEGEVGLDIGDVDRDGKQELIVSGRNQKIFTVKKDSGWAVTSLPVENEIFNGAVVADADHDEYPEVYATTALGSLIQYMGPDWGKAVPAPGGVSCAVNALCVGDGTNDGQNKIYLGGSNGHVYQFKLTEGVWGSTDLGLGGTGPMTAVVAGDGDGSGVLKVYASNGDQYIRQFSYNGNAWILSGTLGTNPVGAGGMNALVTGTIDGSAAIYGANNDGNIYQFKYNQGAWVVQAINSGNSGMHGLAINDGDSDGRDELYAACEDGHVYQYAYANGQWQQTDIGHAGAPLLALAIGAGENNNQFEVYAAGENGRVYQFKALSEVSAILNAPKHQIKAIPSRINPAKGESAAIRWYQPESCTATLKLYNLRGELVKTLADNKYCEQGVAHEVVWRGDNEVGSMVASGIYLVYLQAGDYRDQIKVGVLK